MESWKKYLRGERNHIREEQNHIRTVPVETTVADGERNKGGVPGYLYRKASANISQVHATTLVASPTLPADVLPLGQPYWIWKDSPTVTGNLPPSSTSPPDHFTGYSPLPPLGQTVICWSPDEQYADFSYDVLSSFRRKNSGSSLSVRVSEAVYLTGNCGKL